MQIDMQKIKLLIGEQAVMIAALGAELEIMTKERDELKAKLDMRKPRVVEEEAEAG